MCCTFFFFNDTATTEIYTLSLHDALPIYGAGARIGRALRDHRAVAAARGLGGLRGDFGPSDRSEEHTSELQSQSNLVCRLLLEKKKNKNKVHAPYLVCMESIGSGHPATRP